MADALFIARKFFPWGVKNRVRFFGDRPAHDDFAFPLPLGQPIRRIAGNIEHIIMIEWIIAAANPGRRLALPAKEQRFLARMGQESALEFSAKLINPVSKEFQIGAMRIGFLDITERTRRGGKKMRWLRCVHSFISISWPASRGL